jgi:hypothetical protein
MFFFSFWNGTNERKFIAKKEKRPIMYFFFHHPPNLMQPMSSPFWGEGGGGGKKKVTMRPIPFTLLNTFGMLPLPWSCYMNPRSQAQS